MSDSNNEVSVNYFVICDQVITEAQTGKQSLIGTYSALMAQSLPFYSNIAVAIGIRVTNKQSHQVKFRLVAPDKSVLFESPVLPYDEASTGKSVEAMGFATLQMGVNLQAVPMAQVGTYLAELVIDDLAVSEYSLSVQQQAPPPPAGGSTFPRAQGNLH